MLWFVVFYNLMVKVDLDDDAMMDTCPWISGPELDSETVDHRARGNDFRQESTVGRFEVTGTGREETVIISVSKRDRKGRLARE